MRIRRLQNKSTAIYMPHSNSWAGLSLNSVAALAFVDTLKRISPRGYADFNY
jgi:hypothetical protein